MPKTNGLTVKQEKFVNEVVQGRSYREAALKAGYSLRTANNASRDIRVKPCVQEELTKRVGEEGISAGYVLRELKKDVEDSEGPNPVRTKSLELMGKHLGLFGERGAGTEGVTSKGMPQERREAMFADISQLRNNWEPWADRIMALIPPEKQKEAAELCNQDTLLRLMFARVDLEVYLHSLGEEYRRKVPCGHCGQVTVRGAYE